MMPEPTGVSGVAGVASAACVSGVAGAATGVVGEGLGTFREPLWRDVVGEVLREERQTRERTLQDVADAARISMPYLSEIERGRKEASSEVLAAATRALGISMTELLVRVRLRLVAYEHAASVHERAVCVEELAATAQERAVASQQPQATLAVAGSQYTRAAAGASKGVQSRDALCLAA